MTSDLKKCVMCEDYKQLSEFYSEKRSKDGRQSKCKKCFLIVTKRWRDKSKDKIKKIHDIYYSKNKDKILLNTKEWMLKNKKKCSLWRKEYYLKNKTKNRCRWEINGAIKRKKINRPEKCQTCGIESKTEAHHCDYLKPLEVMWLCKKCHSEWHKNNKVIIEYDKEDK